MSKLNKSACIISKNAAYLILIAQYREDMKHFHNTLNEIKDMVEERMEHIKYFKDSKLLANGDKIIYQGGRWYYSSYSF